LAQTVLGEAGYLDTFRARPEVDIDSLLARHGLEWHRRPLGRLDGALVLFDAEYSVITNSSLSLSRQRLVAAHELGHYLMHRGRAQVFFCRRGEWGSRQAEAQRFARELLMPAQIVWWLWRRGDRTPMRIAEVLRAPVRAVEARLREIGLDGTLQPGRGG